MAVQNPPSFLQAGSHPSEEVRRAIHALAGARGGIVAAGDLAVSENGTPNMTVNVAAGRVLVPGTEASFQGLYHCESRATENRAIAAADPTNARKDLVVARVKDAAYSGAVNSWDVEVVTGTPAPSPSEPAVPANSWVLALVDVPALDTAITNSQITDRRTSQTSPAQQGRAAALGGIIVCTSTTRPAHQAGRVIFETDTNKQWTSDGTNWVRNGEVAYAEAIADQGSITTIVDLTSLTVSFTAVSGRKYKVTAKADFLSDTASDFCIMTLTDSLNNQKQDGRSPPAVNASQQTTAHLTWRTASLSGAVTLKLRGVRNAGASTITLKASSTTPAFLLVEDIT